MTAAAGILRLHSDDDVAVAIRNLRAGEMIDDLVMQTDIPSGHKVATRALATGDVIRKYGQPVGVATRDIARGAHVHTHNIVAVQSGRDEIRIRYRSPRADSAVRASFRGFRRANGKAGTRNYVGIVSTVNCSATVVRKIVERFPESALAAYPGVDGLVPVTHSSGCGMPDPSPGNIEGGLSTILEKSLGAVAKSGTSPLCSVFPYAGRIDRRGFVFMDSPGYDPCSVTGEIAAGANIICFTTGRGAVFGAKPAPSIKLASNSEIAGKMSEDIDYDCGPVLHGKKSLAACGDDVFDLILATASGKKSASEKSGFGDLEFVPWQLGITL